MDVLCWSILSLEIHCILQYCQEFIAGLSRRALELDPECREARTELGKIDLEMAQKACCATLDGHSHGVYSAAFRPEADGESPCIATASCDCTVRLWDATAWVQLAVLEGHTDQVPKVRWSGDRQIMRLSCVCLVFVLTTYLAE